MKHTAARCLMLLIAAAAGLVGTATTAQAESRTLDKIRSSGTLTLGYRESSIPFSFLGAGQKPVGLSLDLCAAIAEKVKSELKMPKLNVAYLAVNAANRIILLQNGTIDIECGSTTNTLERQKQVGFSIPTFVGQPTWLTTASSGITEEKGLKGKTVVITQGSLNLGLGVQINIENKLGVTILQTKDHAESILMLRTGRASAWFEDNILEAGLVAGSPDPKAFRYLPSTNGHLYYYGLMIPREDPEFKALVDGVLKAEMTSGQFSKIYDKWFTHAIPPHDQNLALPMSTALRERVAAPSDVLAP
jgi:glutamate/aspartate transport system substrate-binding protein